MESLYLLVHASSLCQCYVFQAVYYEDIPVVGLIDSVETVGVCVL